MMLLQSRLDQKSAEPITTIIVGLALGLVGIGCDPTCLGKATVVVTDANGGPLSGATITWQCCDPAQPGGCVRVTDNGGRALYEGADVGGAGACEIRVEKAGFASVTQRYEWTCEKGHATTVTVPVTLRP
jgi:hypothetical protein